MFGGTITPFENETFMLGAWTPEGEAKRIAVNEWMRGRGAFHAVIDFDKVLRDPDIRRGCCRFMTMGIICIRGISGITGWAM